MDYQKVYNRLIERARQRQLEGYRETHHVIPKCMGGSNDLLNLVELTAREHFICHWLLIRIHPTNFKLAYAFWGMCNLRGKGQDRYVPSSRCYSEARELFSVNHSKSLKGKEGPKRPWQSEKQLGRKRPDVSAKLLGIKRPIEVINKLVEVAKLRKQVICPHCQKVGDERAMKRWHFNNCRNKIDE